MTRHGPATPQSSSRKCSNGWTCTRGRRSSMVPWAEAVTRGGSWNRSDPMGSCTDWIGTRRCCREPGRCSRGTSATCSRPAMRTAATNWISQVPLWTGCCWIWDCLQINWLMTAGGSASRRMDRLTCDSTRPWVGRSGNGSLQSVSRNWRPAYDPGVRSVRVEVSPGLSWTRGEKRQSVRGANWPTALRPRWRDSVAGDIPRLVSSRHYGLSSTTNLANSNGHWQRPFPGNSCQAGDLLLFRFIRSRTGWSSERFRSRKHGRC